MLFTSCAGALKGRPASLGNTDCPGFILVCVMKWLIGKTNCLVVFMVHSDI